MLNETWKEQYDRMQRSFALLKQIGERNAQPQDLIPARDVLYHFCCDAFHLRDWIAATLGTDEKSTRTPAKQIDNEVIPRRRSLLGHNSIAITGDVYGHTSDEAARSAVSGLADRLGL
jgi:hypothetical protein